MLPRRDGSMTVTSCCHSLQVDAGISSLDGGRGLAASYSS